MGTKTALPEILLNTQGFFSPHKADYSNYDILSEMFQTNNTTDTTIVFMDISIILFLFKIQRFRDWLLSPSPDTCTNTGQGIQTKRSTNHLRELRQTLKTLKIATHEA
jgi:hypothetical protein